MTATASLRPRAVAVPPCVVASTNMTHRPTTSAATAGTTCRAPSPKSFRYARRPSLGALVTMSSTRGAWTANYGLHANEFRRVHSRDSIGLFRDPQNNYSNYGTKGEVNAFAKSAATAARWHLYSDAQIARRTFTTRRRAIDRSAGRSSIPKSRALRPINDNQRLRSAGLSRREPARSDLLAAKTTHRCRTTPAVRPSGCWISKAVGIIAAHRHGPRERVRDGVPQRDRLDRRAVAIGPAAPQRRPSYRRGSKSNTRGRPRRACGSRQRERQPQPHPHLDAVLRRLRRAGNITGSERSRFATSIRCSLPRSLSSDDRVHIDIQDDFALTARHVGRSYLDNTNNGSFIAPAFTTFEASAGSHSRTT